jgi:Photosynthesis system II assembly factor YCF48
MQNLPKIVQARLQRPALEAAPRHPDADLLTAFAEQSLGESEREHVTEHLARCGNCREVVALALPATEAVFAPGSSPVARGGWLSGTWLSWPALRWCVVAAGLVLVTSVGILQYKQRTQQNAALVSIPVRQSDGSDGQAIVLPAPEIAKQTPMRKLSRGQKAVNTEQPSSSANAIFPSARPLGLARSSKQAPSAPSENAAAPFPAVPSHEGAVSGASQMVEAESARIAAPDRADTHAEEQLAQNRTDDLPSQKPPLNNLDVVKAKDSVAPQAQSTAEFAPAASTPNLSLQNGLRAFPRWAIASSGALQRSFDAGRTWEDVNPSQTSLAGGAQTESTAELKPQYRDKKIRKKDQANPALIFRAVSAYGPEVWAGGSSAMLYHSTDSGSHWTRVVPLEANASPTGDIVGVEFSDAQNGKIATSSGELWITSDNGQIWHKQQ